MVAEVLFPQGESEHLPGNPIKLSETHEDTFTPPPVLGQHNQQVFCELLRKSERELAALEEAGVI
ncbi:MAG: hypothetical protein QF376_03905 [Anaerolineales bacterium]|jgi:crotonobetainyl-CoA:carnitine CoA-transferase CaiB-like acyl-CoA transferase|nr:hypothetical protein [Anaerolineales bacterium]